MTIANNIFCAATFILPFALAKANLWETTEFVGLELTASVMGVTSGAGFGNNKPNFAPIAKEPETSNSAAVLMAWVSWVFAAGKPWYNEVGDDGVGFEDELMLLPKCFKCSW